MGNRKEISVSANINPLNFAMSRNENLCARKAAGKNAFTNMATFSLAKHPIAFRFFGPDDFSCCFPFISLTACNEKCRINLKDIYSHRPHGFACVSVCCLPKNRNSSRCKCIHDNLIHPYKCVPH